MWLGVSIAMHAFPSTGDAAAMWKALTSNKVPALAKIVGMPLVVVIYIGAMGSIFWLDAIYGVGVALAVPKLLVWLLA
jgi:hypothetical protein